MRLDYLSAEAEVQGHIHAGLRCAPTTKTYKRSYWKRLAELQDARDFAREKWREVESPELPYRERMIRSANGHPDLRSTQAARRICKKKGIEWE